MNVNTFVLRFSDFSVGSYTNGETVFCLSMCVCVCGGGGGGGGACVGACVCACMRASCYTHMSRPSISGSQRSSTLPVQNR